jgi:zinc protease
MQTNRKQKITKLVVVTATLLLIPLLLFWLSAVLPAQAQSPPGATPVIPVTPKAIPSTAPSTAPSNPPSGTAKHYTDLTLPPLPAVQVPKYDRFTLKNGIVVYLMEDRELPLVSGSAVIRTGDRLEAADKVGLGSVMATVMRSGGTKLHSADQLNQILEQKAASIETSLATNSGGAGFSALSEDLPQVLDLFAEVLQQSAFPEDKINLAKLQIQGGIARRNDDPDGILSREFRKLLYGATSPYARMVEYSTLKAITRQGLVDFYNTWYRPENLTIGIVGDFDSVALKAQLEKTFGSWQAPKTKLTVPALPRVQQDKVGGLYFIQQPQLNQSYIRIGHLGGLVSEPDYPALSVMNEVLSSFGGRLFNEIRSRQGLAYSVYAAWSPQFDYPGIFVAGGETRSEATVAFVKSMRQEIDRIRTQPVTAAELQAAKDSTANGFVFNFQDPSQTLSRLLRYEYFGYPKDFIFQYQRAIAKVTAQDVQKAAQKHLKPDQLVTIIVGSDTAIKPGLSQLGKVTTVDVTIPQP